ncbi:uncharacterized protein LOC127240523 [Andrographis paniculata]|uniref:uncharacterized protein LOC127240523 n=1 Tax=Andrographis paniculata TaxID=175694 RepID=UPI0021E80728|nr:uncharacterized protein LOC127240523 [Andrographis paniculata]
MQGRLMKWAIKLAHFDLYHFPLRAVKGQAVANFLAGFTGCEEQTTGCIPYVRTRNWLMFFDGSTSGNRSAAGVLLEGPDGQKVNLQLQLEDMTHNSAEYEALILRLEALIARKVQSVIIKGDSQLVINQVNTKYVCNYPHLRWYRDLVGRLLSKISEVIIEFVSKEENQFADDLAQKSCKGILKDICTEVGSEFETEADWRIEEGTVWQTGVGADRRTEEGIIWQTDKECYIKDIRTIAFEVFGSQTGFGGDDRDCIQFAKGCQECQRHGQLIHSPVTELQDMAVALKSVDQKEVIDFMLNQIIYRYGIPYSLTTDQGLVFTGEKFVSFLAEFGIRLNNSSPYYPQANGNNRSSATRFSPYQLSFGQDAVLPAEVQVSSGRTSFTNDEFTEEYQQMMLQQLESLDVNQLHAIDQIVKQNEVRAKTYGKKIFYRIFKEGDLIWKTILITYKKVDQLGKWSPNWEGLFIVQKEIGNGAYIL